MEPPKNDTPQMDKTKEKPSEFYNLKIKSKRNTNQIPINKLDK